MDQLASRSVRLALQLQSVSGQPFLIHGCSVKHEQPSIYTGQVAAVYADKI